MANILQVSNIPVRQDRNTPDIQKNGNYEENQQVQNPVDVSRVVRADGQGMEDAKNATTGNGYSIIDYESNYGAFIKKIAEGTQMFELLEQLFDREGTGVLAGLADGFCSAGDAGRAHEFFEGTADCPGKVFWSLF